jgi:hypothetical protein
MGIGGTGEGEAARNGSDANQENIEERFTDLYVKMMEKKVEFTETLEPYKADKDNAGKG